MRLQVLREARVVLDALKQYGMLVVDNGSNWYISVSTDSQCYDMDLDQLKTVPANAFEVVHLRIIDK